MSPYSTRRLSALLKAALQGAGVDPEGPWLGANLRRRADRRRSDPLPSAARPRGVDRAPSAHNHRRRHRDLRPGYLLKLRGEGEGTVPGRDAPYPRRGDVEADHEGDGRGARRWG